MTALTIMRLLDIPPAEIVAGSEVWFDGREILSMPIDEMRKIRGNDIAMIFQEPLTSLNPVFTIGDQIAEQVELHKKVKRKEAWDRAIEALTAGRHPEPGAPGQAVPARDVRRHAPARDDRDGPLVRAEAADRRRADDRARRDDPGPDPGAPEVDPGADRLGADADHPRPRRRRRDGRPRHRHVRRPGRGAGDGRRGPPRAAAPRTRWACSSRSRPSTKRGGRLSAIKGTVPSPFNLPPACRFEPRCPYAWELCREKPPELVHGRAARASSPAATCTRRRRRDAGPMPRPGIEPP